MAHFRGITMKMNEAVQKLLEDFDFERAYIMIKLFDDKYGEAKFIKSASELRDHIEDLVWHTIKNCPPEKCLRSMMSFAGIVIQYRFNAELDEVDLSLEYIIISAYQSFVLDDD